MTPLIKSAAGKVTFLKGNELKFSSLEELMEIITRETDKMPEYITVLGESMNGKTFQLGLDYNIFSESNVDINTLKSNKFQRFLGDILVDNGFITKEKLTEALTVQKKSPYNERVGEVLIRLGFITHDQILAALQEQMGTDRT